MHQARWIARALYSLKITLLSAQFNIANQNKIALFKVCLYIVPFYVKPWLQCTSAIKAPYQDLCVLKAMKCYEKIDKNISKVALYKLSQHLWYLTDEIAILSLFDEDVYLDTKVQMVANLNNEHIICHGKRYTPSKEELCGPLYG